jgi:two-component system response regulator RegA
MNNSNPTLLCVDDNRDNCELLAFVFKQAGFEVKTCQTISEGLYQAKQRNYSAIILDNHFGETSSLEVCREIRWFDPVTPIVFYSGEVRQSEIEKALNAGANSYLIKPNDFDKLSDTVIKLIREVEIGN